MYMKDTHVNYDALAPTYNQRFEEDKDRPATARALLELAGNLNAQRVLEVGCGTGKISAEIMRHVPAVTVADISELLAREVAARLHCSYLTLDCLDMKILQLLSFN